MRSKFTVHQTENGIVATSYDESDFTPVFNQQSQGIHIAEITDITTNYEDIYISPRFMRDSENGIDVILSSFVADDDKVYLMLKALEGSTPVEGYFNNLSFEVAK